MSNKIFLDSSILVEYRKGTQTDLLEVIVTNKDFEPLINQVVVSEYLFYHLAIFSGKSPMSVKSANEIKKYLSMGDPEGFLSQFGWLNDFSMLTKKLSFSWNRITSYPTMRSLFLSVNFTASNIWQVSIRIILSLAKQKAFY